MNIVTKRFNSIPEKDISIIRNILAIDAKHTFEDLVNEAIAIYYENELAGFYTPHTDVFNGRKYLRCVPLYIIEKFRKKGIAKYVLERFYKDKPAKVWIDDNNVASINLHESLGFVKAEKLQNGHYYIKEK